MKSIITTASWVLILGLSLVIPLSGAASDCGEGKADQTTVEMYKQKPETDVSSDKQNKEKKPNLKSDLKKEGPSTRVNMPVYIPPLRGAPAGRVAGGTRGLGDKFPYLCVLVPDHVGLTVHDQPCLYYFLSELATYPIEFTIIEEQAVYPFTETRIQPPEKPGVQSICIADYGVHLKQGTQYKWFVALVPDSQHRSKDILAAGAIELVDFPSELKTKLEGSGEMKAPYIYAEAGIWYDALSALSGLIEKAPENIGLRKQRASLLEQVGLSQVARYEIEQCVCGGH